MVDTADDVARPVFWGGASDACVVRTAVGEPSPRAQSWGLTLWLQKAQSRSCLDTLGCEDLQRQYQLCTWSPRLSKFKQATGGTRDHSMTLQKMYVGVMLVMSLTSQTCCPMLTGPIARHAFWALVGSPDCRAHREVLPLQSNGLHLKA